MRYFRWVALSRVDLGWLLLESTCPRALPGSATSSTRQQSLGLHAFCVQLASSLCLVVTLL